MQVALNAFSSGKTRCRKPFITTKCQIILNRINTCLNYASCGDQLNITGHDKSSMRRGRGFSFFINYMGSEHSCCDYQNIKILPALGSILIMMMMIIIP